MIVNNPQPNGTSSGEFDMKWSDNYSLNRLPEEEAARMRKIIEERRQK